MVNGRLLVTVIEGQGVGPVEERDERDISLRSSA